MALWTFVSRLLGLVRDVVMFASLGTGPLNSAFILAFTLPNLFRRLLGEGALTSSSIPVLAEAVEKRGRAGAFRLLNGIIGRLGLLLLVLQAVAIPVFACAHLIPGLEERWYAAARLSQYLFPYMLVICLAALVCGMLNVLHRFNLTASNQILINGAMIAVTLGGLWLWPDDPWSRVLLICAGVLAGGVLQLLVPAAGLMRHGWAPRPHLQPHPDLPRVMRLFLPGLLGSAIFQLNIMACRFLAFSLDDTATSLLYLAARLVELPLGVFAIAVATVVFPELARLSSTGREEEFERTYNRGLGFILMITLPATLGLILLARPILGFLFQWGLFDSRDVSAAVPVLAASVLGMPFFAWSTLLTRAWYARQQMATPVRLAGLNLALNLVLGLILMRFLGAVGLALANALSSLVHCVALQYFLPGKVHLRASGATALRLGGALAVLAAICLGGGYAASLLPVAPKVADFVLVAVVIPLAMGGYFAALWVSGHRQLRELLRRGGD